MSVLFDENIKQKIKHSYRKCTSIFRPAVFPGARTQIHVTTQGDGNKETDARSGARLEEDKIRGAPSQLHCIAHINLIAGQQTRRTAVTMMTT